MAQVTARLKRFDQLLKGQILMGIGCQRNLSHPSQQFYEGRILGNISAKHQRIDEEPD